MERIDNLEEELTDWKQKLYDKELEIDNYKYLNEKQGKELIELEKQLDESKQLRSSISQPVIIETSTSIPSNDYTNKPTITQSSENIESIDNVEPHIISTSNVIQSSEDLSPHITLTSDTQSDSEIIISKAGSEKLQTQFNLLKQKYNSEIEALKKTIEEQKNIIEELKKDESIDEETIKGYENDIEILQSNLYTITSNNH